MDKLKIAFFAHDPGGANTIAPLIDEFGLNHEVYAFAKGPALSRLQNAKEYYDGILNDVKPNIIITGTSANDATEKTLWKEAQALGIKSIAILDHWVNYGIRFSKYGLKDIDKFEKICDFLPSFIIVMDEFAKKEMTKEGVPEDIILALGNPHFDKVLKNSENVLDVRAEFAKNDETLIVFGSEPYTEDYGLGEEKTVLKDLIEATKNKNVKIVVKLHPKEDFSKYKEFENEVILNKETNPAEIMKAADIVVSMTSMFLIEAMIMNKKILSYQPNEQDKSKFILTNCGVLPFINNYYNFEKELLKLIDNKCNSNYNNFIKENSVERIRDFVEGLKWES